MSRVSHLLAWPGNPVEVSADGRTVFFPWIGSRSAGYRVEVFETAAAITAVAISQPKPADRLGWWAGPDQSVRLAAHLDRPIGGRVFLDLRGDAAPLTMSGSDVT